MACPRCGAKTERGWEYCARCGFRMKRDFFGDILSRFRKEFEEMDKVFGMPMQLEAFDISPLFEQKMPKSGAKGFSIKIITSTGQEPKVSVRTFGDLQQKEIEEQLASQLGLRKVATMPQKPKPQARQKVLPMPKITEEPKTEIKRLDSKVVVNMEVPGVKSENDIEINDLDESIEVKAIAGDKAYFKILTKPAEFRLVKTGFEKGKLHLEFA